MLAPLRQRVLRVATLDPIDDLVAVIDLAGEKRARFDARFADEVSAHFWHATLHDRVWYAHATIDGRKVSLHRFVWRLAGREDTPEIDHENSDGLDCRGDNLRPATRGQNAKNLRLNVRNTSGVKGVNWSRSAKKWQVRISVDRVTHCLGSYADLELAALVYEEAARRFHLEFANPARRTA